MHHIRQAPTSPADPGGWNIEQSPQGCFTVFQTFGKAGGGGAWTADTVKL